MIITAAQGAARRAGIRAGDELLLVNGHPIQDVLDYRFYTYRARLCLRVRSPGGGERLCRLVHEEGGDIGLTFESYLMDEERSCRNRCVFCFIDQNPNGMRKSIYHKDDDARLSFLWGNYITLTNLSEAEIERLCRMRVSPLGISVHTTDPQLRTEMLGNPRAGECFSFMQKFASAGITMGGQIVLCPGYNDGKALFRTLSDLDTLGSALHSVSLVPVGLTAHRKGLPALRPVSKSDALEAIETASGFPRVYPSDEMFLIAGKPIPPPEFYDGYPQLENGVGMLALFREEWLCLSDGQSSHRQWPPQTLVTGMAAAPFFKELLEGSAIRVIGVENRFFGGMVDVAGLLTGFDLLTALSKEDLGQRILLPQNMLRHKTDVFLDDMTVPMLEAALGVPICVVSPDANSLYNTLCNI